MTDKPKLYRYKPNVEAILYNGYNDDEIKTRFPDLAFRPIVGQYVVRFPEKIAILFQDTFENSYESISEDTGINTDNDWIDISLAPKDGTPIVIGVVVKWTAYKPQARKQGYPQGRWQKFNGYGWENLNGEPDSWQPLHLPKPPAKEEDGA